MSDRQQQITRALVRVLREAEGTPVDETVLHFRVGPYLSGPDLTFTELRGVLEKAEAAGLVSGMVNALQVRKWAITEKGQLAEL